MRMPLGRAAALAAVPALLALGAGSAAAVPASGNPPPPAGFEADSASFVSASTGYVLGARGCSEMPCKALLEKTVDGGKTWTKVPMPAVKPAVELVPPFTGAPRSAVNTVRFENARDGWLFGPGLWATTDAGAHWHRVRLPGEVIALAASDGTAFAITEPINGSINDAKLHESQVGSRTWSLVPGVSPANALTVFGHSVWAGIAPKLWRSADGGRHWTKLSFHCPANALAASPVAAASTRDVALACSDEGYPQPGLSVKKVYTSTNGGRTFHLAGRPAEAGQVRLLAMPPGHPRLITLSADSGASYFYRSVNGGRTWQQEAFFDGGLEFRDLAYVSATTGYAIHFSGGPVIAYGLGLVKTVDAGASWTTVSIP